ncbi:TolC family protein [Chitinophaga oryzae]|uniref:TolC family protein n=1 Tax=Chitinophaga oryzae TaxID=2725414 RepID=A0AAE7D9A5_9BACT|nr:TolC family protein [Chitinophaga oryzae]QJB34218.1 TolC family protein [Chitinophaga oryzae]QJB40739.1 TolC family protein [Chitinophaga oryzae]
MRISQIAGFFLFFCFFANITPAVAQDTWSLKRCVDYAMEHSITVKQQEVQKRLAELTLQQSRLSMIPGFSGNVSAGYSDGRIASIQDNAYINQSVFNASGSLNMRGDLFNWFSKQNQIAANRLDAESNSFLLQKARNDLAFNVATAFLQILLKEEQVKVNEVQVKQTLSNLDNTKKLVIAGSVPESNQADLEAQLAQDSTNLVTARNDVILAILQMKAYLNLGFEIPFVPEIPENIATLPMTPLGEMDPEMVYSAALTTYPLVKSDELRIKSADRAYRSAKGQLYPTLSLVGGLSTSYANNFYDRDGKLIPFNKQLDNTFGKNIGLSLGIPLFSGWQQRTAVAKAKVNVHSMELSRDLDNQKLRQDIYTAHANAVAALQKFNASTTGVMAAQKAYDFATKRFNLGLMNTIDYITTQTRLFKAQIDKVSAQYDYIFKMKLLEFYRDQRISL